MSTDALLDLTYLYGNKSVLESRYCGEPFSADAIGFLADLSKAILKDSQAKAYPDLITFAFFCRSSNLSSLCNGYDDINIRLGWGRALHLAPANIPINFAYSFVFSLLAGNANVVRVPTKNYLQIDRFIEIFKSVVNSNEHSAIAENNAFVRFPRESEFLTDYIASFDAVLVWGGDKTVAAIRSMPRAPRSVEIDFSDRYSLCVIHALSIDALNDDELSHLCSSFYNDTYLVDQNACSSPRLIYWLGDSDIVGKAKTRLWQAMSALLKSKYQLNPVHAMDRKINELKILERFSIDIQFTEYCPQLVVGTINELDENNHELTGSFGLFFEYEHIDLEPMWKVLNPKYQTLSYFGLNPDDLRQEIINNRCRGIDRIVPIGSALDIGLIWDGFDLIRNLSRIISIKTK